ncbi:MAG: aminotransferase class IV [Psychrobacter sp.]|nr:aminotransferase class IV [Psychrobacter sp.]
MPSNNWLRLPASDDMTEVSVATMSPDNRGLVYGDGFFTTMGVIDGRILWSDYHHQRLISHAKALQLKLDSHSLLTTLQGHAQQLAQGMLKLVVTRAVQDVRGYGYTPSTSGSACEAWLKTFAMTLNTGKQLPLSDGRFIPVQPTSTAVCLSSKIACLPSSLAGLKSLNRLDNVLASGELQRMQAEPLAAGIVTRLDEGLLRDMSGNWVEGTMSNVFYQLSEPTPSINIDIDAPNYLTTGQWYTPSMAQSGVAGVMRQVIIDALSDTERPVVIRSLQDEDLPRVTQFFFCNALRGIMPMSSLRLLSGDIVDFAPI